MSNLDKNIKKNLLFTEDPQYAVFKELQEANQNLSKLTEEVKKKEEQAIEVAIDPEEIRGPQGPQGQAGKDGKDAVITQELKDEIFLDVLSQIPTPKDGKNGLDGSPDTGEVIINKINGVGQDGPKIDASHIDNLPQSVQTIVERVGGFIETPIKAGTNISVTKDTFGSWVINNTQSGGVTSVSNSDGTLTISPTTGLVVASLNLGNANTWTAQQTFNTSAPIFGTMTAGSILFAGTSGLLSQDNSNLFWNNTNKRLGLGTTSPQQSLHIGAGAIEIGSPDTTPMTFAMRTASALFTRNDLPTSYYHKITSSWSGITTDNTLNFEVTNGSGVTSPILGLRGDKKIVLSPTGSSDITLSVDPVNPALFIGQDGQSAVFRLLPFGNDIYFDNTVNGNIYFRTNQATSVKTLFTLLSSGNAGIGNTSPGELLTLGTSGTTKGVLSFAGNTSGKVIIQPAAAAGSWTLTLPTSAGTSGYALTTNGSGVASWTNIVSSQWTTSGSDIYFNTGKVSIGTTSGSYTLNVSGAANAGNAARFIGNGSVAIFQVDNGSGSGDSIQFFYDTKGGFQGYNSGNGDRTPVEVGGFQFGFKTGGSYHGATGAAYDFAMYIDENHRVGIGTITPSYTLDVSGDISTSGNFNAQGSAGFTGSGSYTNFTIIGGIITNAF